MSGNESEYQEPYGAIGSLINSIDIIVVVTCIASDVAVSIKSVFRKRTRSSNALIAAMVGRAGASRGAQPEPSATSSPSSLWSPASQASSPSRSVFRPNG